MRTASSSNAIFPDPVPATGELIAIGTVSVIYALDEDYVVKRRPSKTDDFAQQAYDVEIRAYERLGIHPRIAYFAGTSDAGLVLERGECLRRRLQYLNKHQEEVVPLATRLLWAYEAAEGLSYVHDKGIVHADVGCHNLILDKSGHVKIIDFAGSAIDSEPAMVCYEWCSYRAGTTMGIESGIFAFGSTLFEIESGKPPYSELQEALDPGYLMSTVEKLFAEKSYPNLESFVFKDIISRCWNGGYQSMDGVLRDLQIILERSRN